MKASWGLELLFDLLLLPVAVGSVTLLTHSAPFWDSLRGISGEDRHCLMLACHHSRDSK